MVKLTPNDLLDLMLVRELCRSGRLKDLRETAGLSLREVGNDVGVDFSTIFRWESGERSPRGEKALAYLRTIEKILFHLTILYPKARRPRGRLV